MVGPGNRSPQRGNQGDQRDRRRPQDMSTFAHPLRSVGNRDSQSNHSRSASSVTADKSRKLCGIPQLSSGRVTQTIKHATRVSGPDLAHRRPPSTLGTRWPASRDRVRGSTGSQGPRCHHPRVASTFGPYNKNRSQSCGSGKSLNCTVIEWLVERQFGTWIVCGWSASPRGRFVKVIVPLGGSAAGMYTSSPVWNG